MAEAAGFDSVWASDHLVYPANSAAAYPYNSTGEPPFRPDDGYLEAITLLAVVAGATETIRLGTSALVLPMRPLLLTAKAVSTLDVLSSGRVVLAVSAGWWRAEFEAVGANFDDRGAILDAQLEALRTLWSEGRGSASGSRLAFPEVVTKPRPLQPTGPELWIGGGGPRVWARVARVAAAGWHGIGHDPERIRAAKLGITRACENAGKDPNSVRYSTATGMPRTSEKMRAHLNGLHATGVDQVVFIPRSDSVESVLRVIDLFGSDVWPALRG